MAEGNRVFVGNITGRVHKHELKVDFEKFGRVSEVFIGNGFGFVSFDDARSASRAVEVRESWIFIEKFYIFFVAGNARPALRRGETQSGDFVRQQ